MTSGFDRLEPYPPMLRKRFKPISMAEAFEEIKYWGARSTIPSRSSMTLVLGSGDLILIEPVREMEGGIQLGYHILRKEEIPAAIQKVPDGRKESAHGEPFPVLRGPDAANRAA